MYAVVETGTLTFRYRRIEEPAEIYGGERFTVQFGYDLPETWSRATTPSSPMIEFRLHSTHTTSTTATTATPSTTQTTTETATSTAEDSTNTSRTNGTPTDASEVAGFTVTSALAALLGLTILLVRDRD